MHYNIKIFFIFDKQYRNVNWKYIVVLYYSDENRFSEMACSLKITQVH